MIHFIPKRYTQAKWQAYITEEDKHFMFEDGTRVASLLDLKEALLSVSEEVITHHIQDDHHIANWVEFVVKDKNLADGLRKQHHRWGMIVTLERHMMRTLNLPSHIADYWLRETEHQFTFKDGTSVRSLPELEKALDAMADETIDFHLERQPNDIAIWVNDIVGDYELAELLEESSGRMQMHRYLVDHVAKLHEAITAH